VIYATAPAPAFEGTITVGVTCGVLYI